MYGKSLIIYSCITILIFGALPARSEFSLESYIPEKFTDTKWRVDGEFSLNGNENRNEENDDYSDRLGNSSYNQQTFYLTNLVDYSYTTIPIYFDFLSEISSQFKHSKRDNDNYNYNLLNQDELDYERHTRVSSSGYRLETDHSFDAGLYIINDIFASLTGRIKAAYTNNPNQDEISKWYQYDHYPNDSTVKTSTEEYTEITDNQSYFSLDLKLQTGYGRVYDGRFTSTALYFIEELRGAGLISREPSVKEMLELTEIVYQYRQKHFVDYRLYRIEVLQSIFDFLNSRGVVDQVPQQAQYLIQDVWDYFPKKERLFGYRFRIGPGVIYDHITDKRIADATRDKYILSYFKNDPGNIDTLYTSTNTSEIHRSDQTEQTSFYLETIIEYFKPWTRKLQWNGQISCTYFFDPTKEFQSINNRNSASIVSNLYTRKIYETDYYQIYFSNQLTYYYSSRTLINLDIRGNYQHKKNRAKWHENHILVREETNENNYFSGDFDLDINYRITIPTALNLQFRFNYWDGGENERHDYKIKLGLSHYII